LPYINISSPFGRPLKFLIDTGSSNSFISPEFFNPQEFENVPPISISTAFNVHTLNKQITFQNFKEFNLPGTIKFLIFNFHKYFDGLLGYDALSTLEAKIDTHKRLLITKNATLPLNFKPNFMSENFTIDSNSKHILKLPVDIESGDFFLHKTKIRTDLYIQEGIYNAKNWYSFIEVVNLGPTPQTVFLEQPLKVEPYYSTNYFEIKNFNEPYFSNQYLELNNFDDTNATSITFNGNLFNLIRTDHMNDEEKKTAFKLIEDFKDLFHKENLTFTNIVKHRIRTTDEIPIYTKSYRYPYVHKDEVKRQIEDMLKQGIIRPSHSPWSSPVWIVPKKIDASGKQKWRLVIDYRKLNEKTISDRYPLPNITDILDKLGRSNYFTTIDLASGFHQCEMDFRDIPKTAFQVEGGHFEFVRMPFGLKNAPATFQRVMDNVLGDLQGTI